MVEKYFLGLDMANEEILPSGMDVLNKIGKAYGYDFVKERVGVKINAKDLTGGHGKFREFKDAGCDIFGDLKVHHGANTGYPIIGNINQELPLDYVTVYSGLGQDILGKYVNRATDDGIKIIAFTVHTKIPSQEVVKIYGKEVNDAIYSLGHIASGAGCDAIVLEGDMLTDDRISDLPIKKLNTGMRIDPSDKGSQSRVTSLEQLKGLRDKFHYLVISKRYLNDFDKVSQIIDTLEQ